MCRTCFLFGPGPGEQSFAAGSRPVSFFIEYEKVSLHLYDKRAGGGSVVADCN